jgi:hypothetical protein
LKASRARVSRSTRFFFSFGSLVLLLMVLLEYWPLLVGRIPFPAEAVVQFAVWDNVRPALPPSRHGEDGDIATQFYPWRVHNTEELRHFRMPLWNDAILAGAPMLANAQSAVFDPVHLLTTVVPARFSWGAGIPIRPILAGAGAALLVRAIGGSVAGAWFAGIVFAFSGFLSAWRGRTQESTGIWLPLVLYAVDRVRRDPGIEPLLLGAAACALPMLGGHPEVAAEMAIVAGAFAIQRTSFRDGEGGHPGRPGHAQYGIRLLIVLAGAVALSLVQLGPTVQWILHLDRSMKEAFRHTPAREIATFFSRDIHANPNSDGVAVPEAAAYAGFVTILFAPFAFRHANRRDVWFFVSGFFVSVAIALGFPPFSQMVRRMPTLGGVLNDRFFLVADLSLAVLGGLGLTALQALSVAERRRASPWAWMAVTVVVACGCVVSAKGAQVAILAASAVLLLVLAGTSRCSPVTGGRLAIVLVAIDLFTFQHAAIPFVEASKVYPPAPALEFIRSRATGGSRMATLDLTMGSNFEMMYGLKTPAGYDFRLRRTARILRALGSMSEARNALPSEKIVQSPRYGLLDLLGVRYLLASSGNSSALTLARFPNRFRRVFRDGRVEVFQNETALPRAFFVPADGARAFSSEEEEAIAILSPSFDARRTVVLSSSPGAVKALGGSGTEGGKVTHFREGDGEVSFVVETSQTGVIVVTEAFYPGWRAWVDDRAERVVRADYAFQGITIGPGRHRVLLRYQPRWFWVCLVISAASWLTVVTLVLLGRPRRRSRRLAASPISHPKS